MNQPALPVLFAAALAAATALSAQTTVVFPADYAGVAEGPLNSPNLPFANGTSRVQLVYDRLDLAVPAGAAITHLGFRQDSTLTTLDQGRTLQLEVRMGMSTQPSGAPSSTFDANFAAPPTTVFGPALFPLPNLRDAANPLPNGQFFVPLTTPFVLPAGEQNLVVEYRISGNSGGGTSFNYRLDRADFHSPVQLGVAGCQHSGGRTPQLGLAPVRTGTTLTASLSNAPANGLAVLLVQPAAHLATPYPLTPWLPGIQASCLGQVGPGGLLSWSTVTTNQGSASFSYAIPNNQSWGHLWLAHQVACFDLFAPAGVVVSNGAEVQIGLRPRASAVVAAGPPGSATTGTLNANYCPVAFFRYQ
jgi:hypothetical protein